MRIFPWAAALCLIGGACGGGDAVGPTVATTPQLDSSRVADTGTGIADTAATAAPIGSGLTSPTGITFGSYNMDAALLSAVQNGTMQGGGVVPGNILSLLATAKAKGGHVVIKLCMGKDSYIKNSDGTFSLTKWKALIDRYKAVNLNSYIADGTFLGHFLIDEPQRASRWGGKPISQATVEAMAQYSKQIWPNMNTFVRAAPSWLAAAPVTYRYLDAGWAQYASDKGDVTKYVTGEVTAARGKGLGLLVGMNVLDGGNGSSNIRGRTSGKYSMSASELRTYGTALLGQSYPCAFYMWSYDPTYYGRTDIKSAMSDLSLKAKSHTQASCRQ